MKKNTKIIIGIIVVFTIMAIVHLSINSLSGVLANHLQF